MTKISDKKMLSGFLNTARGRIYLRACNKYSFILDSIMTNLYLCDIFYICGVINIFPTNVLMLRDHLLTNPTYKVNFPNSFQFLNSQFKVS